MAVRTLGRPSSRPQPAAAARASSRVMEIRYDMVGLLLVLGVCVAAERVLELDPGDALADPDVDVFLARAGEVRLRIGELHARRAAVREELRADAVRFRGGREAAVRGGDGDVALADAFDGADDLGAEPVA